MVQRYCGLLLECIHLLQGIVIILLETIIPIPIPRLNDIIKYKIEYVIFTNIVCKNYKHGRGNINRTIWYRTIIYRIYTSSS